MFLKETFNKDSIIKVAQFSVKIYVSLAIRASNEKNNDYSYSILN